MIKVEKEHPGSTKTLAAIQTRLLAIFGEAQGAKIHK